MSSVLCTYVIKKNRAMNMPLKNLRSTILVQYSQQYHAQYLVTGRETKKMTKKRPNEKIKMGMSRERTSLKELQLNQGPRRELEPTRDISSGCVNVFSSIVPTLTNTCTQTLGLTHTIAHTCRHTNTYTQPDKDKCTDANRQQVNTGRITRYQNLE